MHEIEALAGFIETNPLLAVVTGAGCSTRSGIPDYRSPGGAWSRHRPITYNDFMRHAEVRRFYWARSFRGWPRFRDAVPNAAHTSLRELESKGHVARVITQNVDRLHQKAGAVAVTELHGRNDIVVCLDCGAEYERDRVHQWLAERNPQWAEGSTPIAPDGDADIELDLAKGFCEVSCPCGGVLKPYVVFFGESVPAPRVEESFAAVESAHAVLVVGSSLAVWSGFRFARRAAEMAKPLAIINIGPTRADELACLKIEGECGETLSTLVTLL